jgi:hypothetical protein
MPISNPKPGIPIPIQMQSRPYKLCALLLISILSSAVPSLGVPPLQAHRMKLLPLQAGLKPDYGVSLSIATDRDDPICGGEECVVAESCCHETVCCEFGVGAPCFDNGERCTRGTVVATLEQADLLWQGSLLHRSVVIQPPSSNPTLILSAPDICKDTKPLSIISTGPPP